jgi:hypothetical protein
VVVGSVVTVIITGLLLLTVTLGDVLAWVTVVLMALFMAGVGFTYANTTALAMAQGSPCRGNRLGAARFHAVRGRSDNAAPRRHRGALQAVPMGIVMSGSAAAALAALVVLADRTEILTRRT